MANTRLLILESSTNIRRFLFRAFDVEGLEPSVSSATGSDAVDRVKRLDPGVVLLGFSLDYASSLATLERIRDAFPKLPVFALGPSMNKGTLQSIDVVAMGAAAYASFPASVGEDDEIEAAKLRALIMPRLPGFENRASRSVDPRSARDPRAGSRIVSISDEFASLPATSSKSKVDIVAIASSTGGPDVLAEIFSRLQGGLGAPIVIAQHMLLGFIKGLADRLASVGPLRPREGREGDVLEPGGVYLAPSDYHMTIHREQSRVRIRLDRDPPENNCRPAADVLFRSVANVYGARTLAIVLSGMGSDGTRGSREIKAQGGSVIAQDETTSVVWGMPGSVVRSDLADAVLSPDRIALEIMRRASKDRPA